MSQAVHAGLRPLTRLIVVLIVLSPFAFAVPHWIDGGPDYISEWDEEDAVVVTPLPPREPGERLTVAARRPLTGFAINAHHIGDLGLYLDSVDAIAELGANALIVLTPMFQERIDSSEILFVSDKCATDKQLVAILRRAREHGLHTTLLPIVLIERPGEKDWRGVIRPKDWDRWWETYDEFTDRFVGVANAAEVDLLVIGSELNSTEDMLDRWERVADRVRASFKGEIAYSANWDRYEKVKFWPMLDVICVSSYFELLREDPKAAEDDLVEAWAKERDKLLRFAERCEMPLLLSEVGYPSLPWASAHPWNYVVDKGSTADHEAQARCWRAFFRAWTQVFADPEAPAAGFFGYCWSPYYHGDDLDTGYGIKGKPAYDIVRRGMANVRREANAAADDEAEAKAKAKAKQPVEAAGTNRKPPAVPDAEKDVDVS